MDLPKNSPSSLVSVSLLLSGYITSFLKRYAFTELVFSNPAITNGQEGDNAKEEMLNKDDNISIDQKIEMFASCINSSYNIKYMYKSFESAVSILVLHRKLNEKLRCNTRIDRFFELLSLIECKSKYNIDLSNKLVSIEGLQGSGKSTLITKLLSRSKQYRTVYQPQEVFDVEELYNDFGEAVGNAFAYIKNYIIIDAIKDEIANNPNEKCYYLLDSFYHGTCVTNMMSQINNIQDENIAKAAYDWPTDLPMPKLVIFLSCKTEVRLKRIANSKLVTDRSLDRIKIKDEKKQVAYSLVCGPPTIAIDANCNALEVSNTALEALIEYGIHDKENLPYDNNKNIRKISYSSKRMSAGVYSALCNMPDK